MARNKAYRRAEQKIEEARRSRTNELILSGWEAKESEKLTELPESLAQLTQLQSLDLSYNQLTALPEWLGQLPKLQRLVLSENQLSGLPESIDRLTQLEELELDGNRLKALPQSIRRLRSLTRLCLNENEMVELPEWIGELNKLTDLPIGGMNLTTRGSAAGLRERVDQASEASRTGRQDPRHCHARRS